MARIKDYSVRHEDAEGRQVQVHGVSPQDIGALIVSLSTEQERRILEVKPNFYGFEAQVLDHGYVKLVDFMGDDLQPLRNARISTGNATGVDSKKDAGLRTRLWGDQHTSPFEACVLAVEMQLPLFVLRQFDRHRTVSICDAEVVTVEAYDEARKFTSRNEFSGRYSEMPDLFYLPPTQRFKGKGVANKQGSEGELPECVQISMREHVEAAFAESRRLYKHLLEQGLASELARIVLPPAQYTKIHMQAAMLNWFRMLKLRMAPDVQEESRAYANEIANCLRQIWPLCWEVFEEQTLRGATLTREECDLVAVLLDTGSLVGANSLNCAGKLYKKLQSRL